MRRLTYQIARKVDKELECSKSLPNQLTVLSATKSKHCKGWFFLFTFLFIISFFSCNQNLNASIALPVSEEMTQFLGNFARNADDGEMYLEVSLVKGSWKATETVLFQNEASVIFDDVPWGMLNIEAFVYCKGWNDEQGVLITSERVNLCYGKIDGFLVKEDENFIDLIMEKLKPVVTFETYGGDYIAPQTLELGNYVNENILNPARNDDEFLGWYTDSSFTSQFDFSRPILEDTTLYAKWRRATISSGTFVFVSGNTINTGIDGSLVFVSGRNLVIPNLYVCTHEVTQEQYQSIIGINPSFFSTNPATDERQEKRPVENVKWYDTLVYCNKLSIRDGYTPCYTIKGSTNPDDWGDVPEWKDSDWTGVICDFNVDGYRLPTEVEWEYLARGGNTSNEDQFLYSGSNEYDEVAWTNDTRTHEVERKRPNGLGLYDMSGNVCEWCWDEWVEDDEIDENTPLIPDGLDQVRVRKGGYWNSPYRIENREHNDVNGPGVDNDFIGFRVVRTAN